MPKFDLFCKDHLIIILCMLPHLLHLLQPLDVSCFAILKCFYKQQVKDLMQVGVNYINKSNFLTAYVIAHKESIIKNNICNGFAAAGLVLYNFKQVLTKLNT
jgi:hypothetical protein